MLFLFLVVYLALLMLFVFIMLFGPSPSWKDTPVSTAYDFLTDGCYRHIYSLLKCCCGKQFADRVKAAGSCLQTQSHPLLAVFFMTLITAGLLVFLLFAYPKMPNKYFTEFMTCYTVWPTIVTPYIFFFLAMFTDPGRITAKNVARYLEIYKYDYLLYSPRTCETCRLPKPARSKHCNLCGGCIARHDHHCVWVHNCVGHKNHRWFLGFLASTSWITGYGAFAILQTLRAEMERKNVDKFWYLDRGTGQRRKLSFTERWMYMMSEEGPLMGLGAFLFLAFIVVFLFCLYQFHLVLQNTTTNETAKWDDVHEAMEGGKELVVRKPKAGSSGAQRAPPVVDQGSQINVDGLRARRAALSRKKDDEKDTEDSSERPESRAEDEAIGDVDAEWETTVIRSYDDLESLYNRGWLANLWEVLFPDSV